MTLTRGYDISTWQARPPAIPSARFGFARGTYGLGEDSRAREHVAAMRARGHFAGLYAFGVRHYVYQSNRLVSGREQADVLLRLADKLDVTRVCLDWEDDGPKRLQMAHDEARAFIDRVKDVRGECGLYASAWQFKDFGQTWDWVAKWGAAPPSWPGWEFWQYAASYGGRAQDVNYFDGSQAELEAFFNRTSPPKPKPTPRPVEPRPSGEDIMFNVAPGTTERDLVLRPGTVLYADSTLKQRHSAVEDETALGFAGSGAKFHVVVNAGFTNYVHRADASAVVPNVRHYE